MADVKSPFGSKVKLSDDAADRLVAYGYEADKPATKRSSSKSSDK